MRKISISNIFQFKHSYLSMGIFFTIFSIIIFFRNLVYSHIYNYIWFCDITLALFAFAFFTKNDQLIKALISIGLFAQVLYMIEIILFITAHIQLSNTAVELFSTDRINIILSIIIHLFSTNLALLFDYKKKITSKSLLYSFFVIIFIFVLSITLTPPAENINFIFKPSLFFEIQIPGYTYLWPLIAFIILVLPTYYTQKWLYNYSNKK